MFFTGLLAPRRRRSSTISNSAPRPATRPCSSNLDARRRSSACEIRTALEDGRHRRVRRAHARALAAKARAVDRECRNRRSTTLVRGSRSQSGALGGKLVGAGARRLPPRSTQPIRARCARRWRNWGCPEVEVLASTTTARRCIVRADADAVRHPRRRVATRLRHADRRDPEDACRRSAAGRSPTTSCGGSPGRASSEVVYCIGYRGEQIREYVGDGGVGGCDVTFVDEGADLRGTGGALRLRLDAGVSREALPCSTAIPILRRSTSRPRVDAFGPSAATRWPCIRNDDRWDRSNVVVRRRPRPALRQGPAPTDRAPASQHIDYGFSVIDATVIARIPAGSGPTSPSSIAT